MTKTNGRTLTVCSLGLAVVAFAQDPSALAPRGSQFKDADQTLTKQYWTNDRLSNARPMPLPLVDPTTIVPGNIQRPATTTVAAPHTLPGTRPTITATSKNESQSTGLKQDESLLTIKMSDHSSALNPDAQLVSPKDATFGYEYPFNNYQVPDIDTYPYSAVGKLFFVIPPGASQPAGEYVCSGAVFYDSHTVLTARHCMYDYATGTWYSNFIFFPAWNGGPNPAFNNGWTARQSYTWTSNASTPDYDIGLLQLNDAGGFGCNGSSGTQPIWSYTGSLGVIYFGDVSQYTNIQESVVAYPQTSPFSGDSMYQDTAVVAVTNPLGTTNVVEIGNPQTDGSSGGPWIVGIDPGVAGNSTNNTIDGTNLITGLNSFKWTNPNLPLASNGPAFLAYNLWNLYLGYQQLSCP